MVGQTVGFGVLCYSFSEFLTCRWGAGSTATAAEG